MENQENTSNDLRIGLVGDYSPEIKAHRAIPMALNLAAHGSLGIKPEWLETDSVKGQTEFKLSGFDAMWWVGGSPYKSMNGALDAIRFARENAIPFLGTCGGFQHTLIEYTRNALGIQDADHTESNPETKMPLISALDCSLVGVAGEIWLRENSQARRACAAEKITENFHCNYGLNPDFDSLLKESELKITATDEKGSARIVELNGHPFFVATLFQPELSALHGKKHPLITAFVEAAAKSQSARKHPAINYKKIGEAKLSLPRQ